jgi:hypothetical protein
MTIKCIYIKPTIIITSKLNIENREFFYDEKQL